MCDLSIFGMRQVDMSVVTVVWVNQDGVPANPATNAILKLEVAVAGGWLTVFTGQFLEAQPSYQSLPDVCLTAQCMTGYAAQLIPVQPTSISGPANVATLAQQLATQMGFQLENNGVTGTIESPYLPGTAMDQFRSLAEAAGFDYYFDPNGLLIICPRNQGRQGKTAVAVNAQSGLVGYITLQRYGIEVETLFNASIAIGSPINVTGSEVRGTNGLWYPFAMTHELDTVKPDGKWFSRLHCMPFNASVG
jgi:hypothetical protein